MENRDHYYEDYELGQQWTSSGRTITESDIVQYCVFTHDLHPAHMDAEYARGTEFGARTAPGAMVFSYTVGLAHHFNNTAHFTYGHDRLQYPRPVFAGDTIHARTTVDEKREYPRDPANWGMVVLKYEGINQRDEVVFVGYHQCMVRKRGSAR